MNSSPTLIVLESEQCDKKYFSNGRLIVSYKLQKALRFDTPHYARLLHVLGLGSDALVFADFVKQSNCNGKLDQYLGCTSIYFDYNGFVPLATNNISEVGFVSLKAPLDNNITPASKFVLVVEIASEDYVYGRTPRNCHLRS